MAIEASDELSNFLKFLTGEEFPSANEDRLFTVAQAHHHAADGITGSTDTFANGVRMFRAGMAGEAEQAYVDTMEQYVLHNPGFLGIASKYVHRMGKGYRDTATEVQYAKLMIVASLIELLLEFLAALALAWINPGLAMARLAIGKAIMEFLKNSLLARIIMRVVISQILGVGLQVLMDVFVQLYQRKTGTRDRWNPELTKSAAAIGSLGGAVGLGFSGLFDLAERLFKRMDLGENFTNFTKPKLTPGENPFPEILNEGLSEYFTEGLYSSMTGHGWDVDGIAFVAGALSGIAGASGTAIGESLRNGGKKSGTNVPTPIYTANPSPDETTLDFSAPPPAYAEIDPNNGSGPSGPGSGGPGGSSGNGSGASSGNGSGRSGGNGGSGSGLGKGGGPGATTSVSATTGPTTVDMASLAGAGGDFVSVPAEDPPAYSEFETPSTVDSGLNQESGVAPGDTTPSTPSPPAVGTTGPASTVNSTAGTPPATNAAGPGSSSATPSSPASGSPASSSATSSSATSSSSASSAGGGAGRPSAVSSLPDSVGPQPPVSKGIGESSGSWANPPKPAPASVPQPAPVSSTVEATSGAAELREVPQNVFGSAVEGDRAARLEAALAEVLPDYDGTSADCVLRLNAVLGKVTGRARSTRDDAAGHPARPEQDLARDLDTTWQGVSDWDPVIDAVRDGGPSSIALVLADRVTGRSPGRHGFALVNEDGELYWVETQAGSGSRVRPVTAPPELPVGGRAIVLDRNAAPVTLARTAPATVNALVDPPPVTRYGLMEESVADTLTPETPQPESTPAQRVQVPADGFCLLYSVVASDPVAVLGRLRAVAPDHPLLADADVVAWLNDPARVRADVVSQAVWTAHQGVPVPAESPLARVTAALVEVVGDRLVAGPEALPESVLRVRGSLAESLRAREPELTREERLESLRVMGPDHVTAAYHLDPDAVRERYLAAAGTSTVDGLNAQQQLDYLNERGRGFTLDELSDEATHQYYLDRYGAWTEPIIDKELELLTDAVADWSQEYLNPVGEAFLPLLAHVFDVRLEVFDRETRAQRAAYGEPGRPAITLLHNDRDHYDGGAPEGAALPSTDEIARDIEFGPAVRPKKVKGSERDDADDLRLNPLWHPLSEFPSRVLNPRRAQTWLYAVDEHGEIFLGAEEVGAALRQRDFRELLAGMRRVEPTLTEEQLRSRLGGQGHVTIAAGMDPDTGRTVERYGRVSGELSWNAEAGRWEVNDKSGRYMSASQRPDITATEARRWITTVADRLTDSLGVEVTPVLYKHAEPGNPPPPVPEVPERADARTIVDFRQGDHTVAPEQRAAIDGFVDRVVAEAQRAWAADRPRTVRVFVEAGGNGRAEIAYYFAGRAGQLRAKAIADLLVPDVRDRLRELGIPTSLVEFEGISRGSRPSANPGPTDGVPSWKLARRGMLWMEPGREFDATAATTTRSRTSRFLDAMRRAVWDPETTGRGLHRTADGRWLLDGGELIVRSIPGRERSVVLLSDADWARVADPSLLVPENASVPVLVRGSGDGQVLVPVRRDDGSVRQARIGAAELQRVLADRIGSEEIVALLSCAAGTLGSAFTQRLADLRRQDVLAPTGDLVVGSPFGTDGPLSADGRPWALFTPGSIDGDGWDLINDELADGTVHPFDGFVSLDPQGPRASTRDVPVAEWGGVHLASGWEAELRQFLLHDVEGGVEQLRRSLREGGGEIYLVRTDNLSIVIDGPPGARVPEVVVRPAAVLPGDDGRIAVSEAFRDFDEVIALLGQVGLYQRRKVADLFAGPKYEVHPLFRNAVVQRTDNNDALMLAHYSLGVPVAGLHDVLAAAHGKTYVPEARNSLTRALRFGEAGAQRFRQTYGDQATPEAVAEVKGYLALVYTQIAAVRDSLDGGNFKDRAAAVSRVSLSAIRASMSGQGQQFLHARMNSLIQSFDAELGPEWRASPLRNSRTLTGMDYLRSAVDPTAEEIDQFTALGVRTRFSDLDDNGGRLDPALVVLELRSYGSNSAGTSMAELRDNHDDVARWASTSYNTVRGMRGQTPSELPAAVITAPRLAAPAASGSAQVPPPIQQALDLARGAFEVGNRDDHLAGGQEEKLDEVANRIADAIVSAKDAGVATRFILESEGGGSGKESFLSKGSEKMGEARAKDAWTKLEPLIKRQLARRGWSPAQIAGVVRSHVSSRGDRASQSPHAPELTTSAERRQVFVWLVPETDQPTMPDVGGWNLELEHLLTGAHETLTGSEVGQPATVPVPAPPPLATGHVTETLTVRPPRLGDSDPAHARPVLEVDDEPVDRTTVTPVLWNRDTRLIVRGAQLGAHEFDVRGDVPTLWWMRQIATTATSDQVMATIAADLAAGRRPQLRVTAFVSDNAPTDQRVAENATRFADVLRRQLSVGLMRWAERNSLPVPAVDFEIRTIRGLVDTPADAFLEVDYRGSVLPTISLSSSDPMEGQSRDVLDLVPATVPIDPVTGLPAVETIPHSLIEILASHAFAAHLTGGAAPRVILTSSSTEAAAYVWTAMENRLPDAVWAMQERRMSAYSRSARADAEAMRNSILNAIRFEYEVGIRPAVDISVASPDYGPLMPVLDGENPTTDHLSLWRTAPNSAAEEGWWTQHNPLPGVPEAVAALQSSQPRAVHTQIRDVSDPVGQGTQLLAFSSTDVRYDVVRIDMGGGEMVRVFRLRLHLVPGEGVSRGDVENLRQLVRGAVDLVNDEFVLPGGGDRFYLDVQFTDHPYADPADLADNLEPKDRSNPQKLAALATDRGIAHHDILVPEQPRPGTIASSNTWPANLAAMDAELAQQVILHEMFHLLGVDDEYESLRRTGPDARPVSIFRAPPTDAGRGARMPHPGELGDFVMGPHRPDPRSEPVAARYLTRIWQVQESQLSAPLVRNPAEAPPAPHPPGGGEPMSLSGRTWTEQWPSHLSPTDPPPQPSALAKPGTGSDLSTVPGPSDDESPTTTAADPAQQLLTDLYEASSSEVVAEPGDLVGPDVFRLLAPEPMPEFLSGIRQRELRTGQLSAFFDYIDMTAPLGAERETTGTLPASREVWRINNGADRQWWGPTAQNEPAGLRELPRVMSLPHMVHSVWLGGPLSHTAVGGSEATHQFMDNLADLATFGWRVNLWTDVTRAEIEAAEHYHAGEFEARDDAHARHLERVWDMLQWARENNIRLINVDEVFHAGEPMLLDRFYRMELNKQVGTGYAAASDIVRLAILIRFGGLYTDGDNTITGPARAVVSSTELPLWQHEIREVIRRRGGFAVHGNGHLLGNSALLGVRNHPFFEMLEAQLGERYQKKQRDLFALPPQQSQEDVELFFDVPPLRSRRHSVMTRTGPDNLDLAAKRAGFGAATDMPALTEITMGTANSWISQSPFEPRRSYVEEEVGEVLRRVVATLIRGLYNRGGDLYLTAVAPVVFGLPDPDAAFEAAVEYILGHPQLRPLVRTVTDRILVRAEGQPRPSTVEVLPLSDRLRGWLGITGEPTEGDGSVWRQIELSRPVDLTEAPQPPPPDSDGPDSDGEESFDPLAAYVESGAPVPPELAAAVAAWPIVTADDRVGAQVDDFLRDVDAVGQDMPDLTGAQLIQAAVVYVMDLTVRETIAPTLRQEADTDFDALAIGIDPIRLEWQELRQVYQEVRASFAIEGAREDIERRMADAHEAATLVVSTLLSQGVDTGEVREALVERDLLPDPDHAFWDAVTDTARAFLLAPQVVATVEGALSGPAETDSQLHSVHLNRANLAAAVDEIAGPAQVDVRDDPLVDPNACVVLVGRILAALHQRPLAPTIAPARTVDDSVLDGRQISGLAPGVPLIPVGYREVEAALAEAGEGASAVFFWQREDGLGHVFGAHNLGEVNGRAQIAYFDPHQPPGRRVLGGAPDELFSEARLRAVLVDQSGREIPLARGSGASTVPALIDPPRDPRYGRGAMENELHSGYLLIPKDLERDSSRLPWLARHDRYGIEVTVDHGTFVTLTDGTDHMPGVDPDTISQTWVASILEMVMRRPLPEVPGDPTTGERGALSLQERVAARIGRLSEPGPEGWVADREYRLADLFPAAEGWTVHENAGDVGYVPVRRSGPRFVSAHQTHGVPLGALKPFMAGLTERIWPTSGQRNYALELHRIGADFASAVGVQFAASGSPRLNQGVAVPPPSTREIEELEGVMWVTFVHVAALALGTTMINMGGKSYSATALRQNLRQLREELSPAARNYLTRDASAIRIAFEAFFLSRFLDFEEKYRAFRQQILAPRIASQFHIAPPPLPESSSARPLDAVRFARQPETHGMNQLRVGDYLDTVLLDTVPQAINQYQGFGVRTFFGDLDRERSNRSGLFLIEVRNDTAPLIEPNQITPLYDGLATVTRNAVATVEPPAASGWNLGGTFFGSPAALGATVPIRSSHTNESLLARYPWISGVNPDRDRGGELSTNCVIAAISFVMSMREGGGAFEIPGSTRLPGSDLVNFQRESLGLSGEDHQVHLIGDLDSARDALDLAAPGDMALIAVRGPDGDASHVYVGIRDEKGVSFVDPQAGALAEQPVEVTGLAFLPLSPGVPSPVGGRLLTADEMLPFQETTYGMLPPPATAPGAPAAPWYLAHGALGEFSVDSVTTANPARVGRRIQQALPRLDRRHPDIAIERQLRDGVKDLITKGLTERQHPDLSEADALDEERKRMDRALLQGWVTEIAGRLVWVKPAPRNLTHFPENASAVKRFAVSFASTAVEDSRESARSGGGAAAFEGVFDASNKHVASYLVQAPEISAGGDITTDGKTETKLISGRKLFVDERLLFAGALDFSVYVDGQPWGEHLTVPNAVDAPLLKIRFPTPYSRGDQRPADAAVRRAPLEPGEPGGWARETLTAIDLTPAVLALHGMLRQQNVPAKDAARIAERVMTDVLNERSARNRSRPLLDNEVVTGRLAVPTTQTPNGWQVTTADGFVTVQLAFDRLQYLGETSRVKIRSDRGLVNAADSGRGGTSEASYAGEFLTRGIHIDDKPVRGSVGVTLEGESSRETGSKLAVQNANHTILNEKSPQARYGAQMSVHVQLHYGMDKTPDRRVTTIAEWGVPVADRPAFERARTGGVFPSTGPTTTYQAVNPPRSQLDVADDATLDRVLGKATVDAPQQRRRADRTPPQVDEPLAIAAGRGHGPAVTIGLPGAERVATDVLAALLDLAAAHGDVPAKGQLGAVRRTLNNRYGLSALEADPSRARIGVRDTYRIGERDYDVLVIAHPGTSTDGGDEDTEVNTRALSGATTGASRKRGLKGAVGIPAALVVSWLNGAVRWVTTAELGGSSGREWTVGRSRAAKHYRRTETTGQVHRRQLPLVWEIVVRPAGGDRVTRLLHGPGIAEEVAIPHEYLDGTAEPADRVAGTGTVEVAYHFKNAADIPHPPVPAGGPIAFRAQGSSGVYPRFLDIPELPAIAARLYADLHGLPPEWVAEPLNWPREIWDLGVSTNLSAQFAALTDGHGWQLPLTGPDGGPTLVELTMNAYDPTATPLGNGVEIEQYSQIAEHRSDETGWDLGGKLPARTGVLGVVEGEKPAGTVSDDSDAGNRLSFQVGKAWQASRGGATSTDSGHISITRATYKGPMLRYDVRLADFTVQVSSPRVIRPPAKAYVQVKEPFSMVVPERIATLLKLPGTGPLPPAPPAGTPRPPLTRTDIDGEVARSASHIEHLSADGVVDYLTGTVERHGLHTGDAGSLLRRGLVETFSSHALELSHVELLSRRGVIGVFPVENGRTSGYLLAQVKGTLEAAEADEPRPNTSVTLRAEAFDAGKQVRHAGSSSGLTGAGRIRNITQQGDAGGLAGKGGRESGTDTSEGTSHTRKRIYRVGNKDSQMHEFSGPITLTVRIAFVTELPRLVDDVLAVPGTLIQGGAELAGLPKPSVDVNRVMPHWAAERTVAGQVRRIIPTVLTTPASSSTSAQADGWRVARETEGLGNQPQWSPLHAKTARTLTRPLSRVLRGDESFHPLSLPAADQIAAWAPNTRLNRWMNRDTSVDPDGQPLGPGLLADGQDAEINLRARLPELLEHTATIPGTPYRVGLDVYRIAQYGSSGAGGGARSAAWKGRVYTQAEEAPIAQSGTSSGQDLSLLPEGGRHLRTVKKAGGTGTIEGGRASGRGHGFELAETDERNAETVRQLRLNRYDTIVTIYGPHGTVAIDVPGGLYGLSALTEAEIATRAQPPRNGNAPEASSPPFGVRIQRTMDALVRSSVSFANRSRLWAARESDLSLAEQGEFDGDLELTERPPATFTAAPALPTWLHGAAHASYHSLPEVLSSGSPPAGSSLPDPAIDPVLRERTSAERLAILRSRASSSRLP